MDGGARLNLATGREYPTKLTLFAFLNCVVAATGGLIFGYDIGITGGVVSRASFLKIFFPSVYQEEHVGVNMYCRYNNQPLQMFVSSVYLAALVASFFAASVTRALGRKWSMFSGGITSLSGTVVASAAQNLLMLILGRILVGVGLGFVLQSVPVYLSEMAPARLRGVLNISFQLMITIGILCANLVNYATIKINTSWNWRVSLAIAVVPTSIITLGSLFLPETPNSLMDRDNHEEAQCMLRHIRGTDDITDEYNDLMAAAEQSKLIKHPWRNIVLRKYRPQLIISILIPFFQHFTGIDVILFYTPVMLKMMAFNENPSTISAVILGLVNVFSTFVCFLDVDRLGRRKLFLQGGSQMIFCQLFWKKKIQCSSALDVMSEKKLFTLHIQELRSENLWRYCCLLLLVMVGTLIAIKFGTDKTPVSVSQTYAGFIILFICLFLSAYAFSVGPLAWLVPSEIFPLEIRPAGQSIAVSVNMLCIFISAQAFFPMLCHMKFGIFFFFTGWVLIMTIFVVLFLPETKNVPIEEMIVVWKAHWFWGRFIADEDVYIDTRSVEMGASDADLTFVS